MGMHSVSIFKIFISKLGVEIGLIALICFGYFHFKGNLLVESKSAFSKEAQAIILKINDTVTRAEVDEKAFVTSGDEKYLKDYNQQVIQLNQNMGLLSNLVARNPSQRQQVAKANALLKSHFDTVNNILVQKQNGKSLNKNVALPTIAASIKSALPVSKGVRFHLFSDKKTLYSVFGGLLFLIFFSRYLQQSQLEWAERNVIELKRKSILLDTILNSMSEALVVINQKGKFLHYNAAAQRIIGTKIKEIANEKHAENLGFYDVANGELYSIKQLPFHKALHGAQYDDWEIFVQNDTHPQGVYISLSSRSLNDINGGISGALVVFKDVSRRKAVEQEWIKAREAALEASLKKSDFLAAMSHEIRTPMNGVIGMTTLLADTNLNEEQKEYVGTVKRSAESLLMLINDILDHSKIEAGKIQLNPQPFDLKFLAHDIIEILKPAATEKNIGLKVILDENQAWSFNGDQGRLRQILVNLLGNAVKFTESGAVTLKIYQTTLKDNLSQLKFEVKDTGPGLKDDERRALFQKYFQTKNGMKYGGTGLGLSISKQLVDLMNGEIGVESIIGLGSTFWFTISLPTIEKQKLPSLNEVTFASVFNGRILLVEDQVVNQRVAYAYLRKLGLDVEVAGNGLVAYEKYISQEFDLILMDCQMPILNGFEATKRIRKEEGKKGKRIPIIALTADAAQGNKDLYHQSGMDDFLAKPLELGALIAMLNRYLKQSLSSLDLAALKKLDEYMVKDQNLVQALIEDFESSGPELINSMILAYKDNDLAGINQAAHALKSNSATLGAYKLSELCATLESASEIKGAEFILKKIEKEFESSKVELKKYGERKFSA